MARDFQAVSTPLLHFVEKGLGDEVNPFNCVTPHIMNLSQLVRDMRAELIVNPLIPARNKHGAQKEEPLPCKAAPDHPIA